MIQTVPSSFGHRLLAARHVDDGQAAMAEADGPIDPEPLAVRPAVPEHVAHPLEAGLLHDVARVEPDDAGDAAHQTNSSMPKRRPIS